MVLRTLKTRYPGLTDVDIHNDIQGEYPSYLDKALEDALEGWNQLQRLRVDLPSARALDRMATLPILQHLELYYDEFPADFPRWEAPDVFPSLKTLRVEMTGLACCAALLVAMPSIAAITSVDVITYSDSSASELHDFFNVMRSHCRSITAIRVHIYNLYHSGDAVMISHLRPILSFSNVTRVSLRLNQGINLDSEDAEEIAKAWPRIVSLALDASKSNPPNEEKITRLTLWGLTAFARHCPYLENLSLPIDAREVPGMLSGELIFDNVLSYLDVSFSPIRDPVSVAAFLSDIFPALRKIETLEQSVKDQWEQVERLVRVIISVRSRERTRMSKMLGCSPYSIS
jgi:hypothetical protein